MTKSYSLPGGNIVASYEDERYCKVAVGGFVPVNIFGCPEWIEKEKTSNGFCNNVKNRVLAVMKNVERDLENHLFSEYDSQVMSDLFDSLDASLKSISVESVCYAEQYKDRFTSVEASLSNCESRDEAKHILEDELTTSVELKLFARRNSVIATGTKEEVKNRIIEALVGSRLNSRTIRDFNKTAK